MKGVIFLAAGEQSQAESLHRATFPWNQAGWGRTRRAVSVSWSIERVFIVFLTTEKWQLDILLVHHTENNSFLVRGYGIFQNICLFKKKWIPYLCAKLNTADRAVWVSGWCRFSRVICSHPQRGLSAFFHRTPSLTWNPAPNASPCRSPGTRVSKWSPLLKMRSLSPIPTLALSWIITNVDDPLASWTQPHHSSYPRAIWRWALWAISLLPAGI